MDLDLVLETDLAVVSVRERCLKSASAQGFDCESSVSTEIEARLALAYFEEWQHCEPCCALVDGGMLKGIFRWLSNE